MVFSSRLGERVRAWGSSLIMTGREVLCRDGTTLGVVIPGKVSAAFEGHVGGAAAACRPRGEYP